MTKRQASCRDDHSMMNEPADGDRQRSLEVYAEMPARSGRASLSGSLGASSRLGLASKARSHLTSHDLLMRPASRLTPPLALASCSQLIRCGILVDVSLASLPSSKVWGAQKVLCV